MMKLKQSLRNSAKTALLLNAFLILILIFISGCFPLKKDTNFSKENIASQIQDLCKKKYNIDVISKVVGQTIWIYLPLEDIVEQSKKIEKFKERFDFEDLTTSFQEDTIKIDYSIKEKPEEEKSHQISYTKDARRKISEVWKVINRSLFAIKHSHNEGIQFFCFVIADIKSGFEMKQVGYVPDLKKVLYGIIQGNEYHHRTVMEDMSLDFTIIGDKEGKHLNYKNFTLKEFINMQIKQRIKQKFQRPEAQKNVDIDTEIIKTVAYVLKVYDFKDFSEVEFNNLLTNKNEILGKTTLWQDYLK